MGRTLLGHAVAGLGIFLLLAGAASAAAIPFEQGTYVLGNHPDGNARMPTYGLRIDNLFDGEDPFTFDFECAECSITLVYDGSTIDISGTVYGGTHDGLGGREDNEFDGLYEVDVSYDMAQVAENSGDGDDEGLQDIGRADETGAAIGTLKFLSATTMLEPPPPVTMWDLMDKAGGHPFSLRVGDEDDDAGHRGFDGISGWGWLKFREHGTDDPFVSAKGAQDFLFTAERVTVPAPGTAALLLLGFAALTRRRSS